MPAALLVMVLLGAITVDATITFEAQRELVAITQGAANDAASAVDGDRLRGDGVVDIDLRRVDALIRATEAASPPGTTLTWELQGTVLTVRARRSVHLLFTPAVSTRTRDRMVEARASAELRRR